MLPGPETVHACPQCQHHAYRRSFISGNTFSSRLWSDGFLQARMMGDTVQVTRCTNCKAIYWVEDAPVLREVPYGSFAHKARKRRWYSFINLKSIMAATAPSPTPPAMEHLGLNTIMNHKSVQSACSFSALLLRGCSAVTTATPQHTGSYCKKIAAHLLA